MEWLNVRGYRKDMKEILRAIQVVLVEPSHPGNIGGVARSMKTMGIDRLIIVNPTRFPDPQAEWRAAGAKDVLDNAIVGSTVSEAISDSDFIVGTSARSRRIPWPMGFVENVTKEIITQVSSGNAKKVSILFGRESSGLTNEELECCHMHLQIPASPDYSSLNLAMAVQVVCYELFKQASIEDFSSIQGSDSDLWDRPLATYEHVEKFMEHLEAVLVQSSFLDPKNPGKTLSRLRRLLVRARPDETEIQILRGILTHLGD